MFKNYFKTAFRNLRSRRGFSAINIFGLSIGMACCLLIFQYVSFEYSFDDFHENRNDIYRVLQAYAREGDAFDQGQSFTAQALAPALADGVPEIVEISRVHSDNAIISIPARPDRVFEEDRILYADPGFLKIFSFPMLNGPAATEALKPGSVLISESAAQKYFGTLNVKGATLDVTGAVDMTFRVTGVFEDVPDNSHLQFDFLLPIEDLLRNGQYNEEPENGWSWNNFSTYVLLHSESGRNGVERKMTDIYNTHRGDVLRQQGMRGALGLQPLQDIHLNAEVLGAVNVVTGNYRTVYFFVVVGLITFIIALVNYVNLATARAVNRSREVGVRKVVGARRGQLVVQFLIEAGMTNFAAAVIAIVLAVALVPLVNDLAETQISSVLWTNLNFWLAFTGMLAAGTLLAGLYPAFVLSSFRPALVLKGKTGTFSAHLWLRKALVVVQFAASIVLVAGTGIVANQLNYMRQMDLGLDLEQVLTIPAPRILPEDTDRAAVMTTFVNELRRLPAVEQVAASSSVPGRGFNWNGAAIRKATDDPANAIRGVATYIDSAFASLYGLELVAGQEFADVTIPEGEDVEWLIMINRTATESLGFSTPAEAVGQPLNVGGYDARVIGVYEDFNWSSAHQELQNIVFGSTRAGAHISLRLATTDFPSVISGIERLYNSFFPGNVFRYSFADEAFDLQYRNDQRFARLFSISAGLAIFIACLGLMGLVAFTAQQRTKEIGMRKVLGATVPDIIALLNKDFLKLVIVGFLIAVPLAWYTMDRWLENFAYRVPLGPAIFLLAGCVALLIALLTVSWQSIQAALANPVDSLRNE